MNTSGIGGCVIVVVVAIVVVPMNLGSAMKDTPCEDRELIT